MLPWRNQRVSPGGQVTPLIQLPPRPTNFLAFAELTLNKSIMNGLHNKFVAANGDENKAWMNKNEKCASQDNEMTNEEFMRSNSECQIWNKDQNRYDHMITFNLPENKSNRELQSLANQNSQIFMKEIDWNKLSLLFLLRYGDGQ